MYTGEKYVNFLILHSRGVAGCSAPLASLIVGLPSLMPLSLTIISLSRTSSLMQPPAVSPPGRSSAESSVPMRILLTIFSIRLSLPSPEGIQSLYDINW